MLRVPGCVRHEATCGVCVGVLWVLVPGPALNGGHPVRVAPRLGAEVLALTPHHLVPPPGHRPQPYACGALGQNATRAWAAAIIVQLSGLWLTRVSKVVDWRRWVA